MSDCSQLKREIRQCEHCTHQLPLGPRPVVRFSESSKILIVGQAPGIRVHNSGVPFDDPSGDRLRQWLGVTAEEFYDEKRFAIVPMGFCYPGTGSSGDNPPLKICATVWREKVLNALPNIELTLCIGAYAIDWHLKGLKKINLTETVRFWKDFLPLYLPLPHPSPRNNLWLKKNPWFELEVIPELQNRILKVLE